MILPEERNGRVGRRGAALLFFTLLDLTYCWGLLDIPRPLTPLYAWMNHVMPLTVWAIFWGTAGLVCLVYAFRQYDTPAFMTVVGLKTAWGLLALFGWLAGAIDRGYISAVVWLGFSAFIVLIAGGIPPAVPRPKGGRSWIRY